MKSRMEMRKTYNDLLRKASYHMTRAEAFNEVERKDLEEEELQLGRSCIERSQSILRMLSESAD